MEHGRHPLQYVLGSPSHTGYRQYLMPLMREVVENYPVDGIHLDYIRYPEAVEGRHYRYCRRCRKKFKDEYGYELPANDVIKKDMAESFG